MTGSSKRQTKKKNLIILGILFFVLIIIGASVYPKYSNMKSEYLTASAMHVIGEYIKKNGEWPKSILDLNLDKSYEKYVNVNYEVSAKNLHENPDLLKESIRPISGKFYTYPYYQRDLDSLLGIIKEANTKEYQKSISN